MATYVLIPGAGSDSWYWHLVVPQLEARGHEAIAVDLPCGDDDADLVTYTDVVVDAIGDRRDLVLVAQSMGGFTAPLVCERLPVELMVLVAAMVPVVGEKPEDWWTNTGTKEAQRAAAEREGRDPDDDDPATMFLHDVPADLVAAMDDHVGPQSWTPFTAPWPGRGWPDVPTRFLLGRDDRFFPADLQRHVVVSRLGIEPDELPSGHLPALACPDVLVERLESYRVELGLP